MKSIKFFIIFFFISNIGMFSQKTEAKLFFKNKTSENGIIKISTNGFLPKDVIIKFKGLNDNFFKVIPPEKLNKIEFFGNQYYVKEIEYNGKLYKKVLKRIISGSINLYKLNHIWIIENSEYGLRLLYKDIHALESPIIPVSSILPVRGILSLYVNNCSEAHDMTHQKTDLNSKLIMKIIKVYNNCTKYSSTNHNVSNVIVEDTIRDKTSFKAGFGLTRFNTDLYGLNGLVDYKINPIRSFAYQINATIHLKQRKINENLFVKGSVKYLFLKTKSRTLGVGIDNQLDIHHKIKQFNLNTGLGYYIVKNTLFASVDLVTIFDRSDLNVIKQQTIYSKRNSTHFTISTNLGASFEIFDEEFSFNFEYSPGYEYRLLSPTTITKSNYYNIKTNYIGFEVSYNLN